MAWLLDHKSAWPKEVKLTQTVEFQAILGGKVVGSIKHDAGTSVKLTALTSSNATVTAMQDEATVPLEAINIGELAKTAWQQTQTNAEAAHPSPMPQGALPSSQSPRYAGKSSWIKLPPPPSQLPEGTHRTPVPVTDPAKGLAELKEKLSSSGHNDPVKEGVLSWGIEQSERLLAKATFGDQDASSRAKALIGDLLSAVKDSSYPAKKPESPRYFPEIKDLPNNPGAEGIFDLSPYLKTSPSNIRKSGRDSKLEDGDALRLAYTTLHPQSPERGKSEGIKALLTALENCYSSEREKLSWGEHQSTIAYLLLKSVYPDLVPPSVKDSWEGMIRKRAERITKQCNFMTGKNYHGNSWLNGDSRNVAMVGIAGIVLNEKRFSDWMSTVMDRIYELLQPDGATNYTCFQNEHWIYHSAAMGCAAWYWLISDNETAHKFVAEAAPFYPIMVHRGLGEEYTAPEQKHYYNGGMYNTPYLALIAGDPDAVATGKVGSGHLNAFFYDPAMPTGSVPDNFTLFDRNIIGPRGRYGDLDFAISTRDFNYYPGTTNSGGRFPDKGFGFTTIFGMRVLNTPEESTRTWPLNVVAERLMSRVVYKGTEYNKGQQMDSSVAMAGSASAAGATFLTSARTGQNQNWDTLPFLNTQEWIVTPERAVGFMKIEALESLPGAVISNAFEFTSGRGRWGVQKELVKSSPADFRYGKLNLHVIATSHNGDEINYTNGGMGSDKMRGVLHLTGDKAKQSPIGGGKGDTSWCLVEIHPEWSSHSQEIKQIDAGSGLIGVQVTASGKTYTLIHNPGTSEAKARFQMPTGYSKYSLHLGTDGSILRDKYFNKISSEALAAKENGNKITPLSSASVDTVIPPHRIILVVGSNDAADHADGFKFYGDIFNRGKNPR